MAKQYKVNKMIHDERQKHNIKIWEIADEYGLAESSMYRLFRKELPESEQKRIVQMIKKIAKEKELDGADNDTE